MAHPSSTNVKAFQTQGLGLCLDPKEWGSLQQFVDELQSRLVMLFESPNYQPPLLPSTALQVIELSRKPNVTIQQMVATVEQDPMLAAELLKLAQSAAISGGIKIHDLFAAIQRLGLARAGALFCRVAMEAKIFRVAGYADVLERLRSHSVLTAELSRYICAERGLEPEVGYLSGLLHDVGIAGAIIAIVADCHRQAPPSFQNVWSAICPVHGRFTCRLARLWHLPAEVQLALAYAHRLDADDTQNSLGLVTLLAESLAATASHGFQGEEQSDRLSTIMQGLGYSLLDLERLEAVARTKANQP
ncbi:MAG TPA: HDOD domain-containing protein [Polyangiaceae bacterium]